MQSKVALHTLGCKLNFSETSTIGNQFLQKGFQIVDYKKPADIYVLNTCTVTENAEKECRQIIRRFLRQNPEAFVVVTGCYAQLRPQEIAHIKGVDVVLGSNEKLKLFSLVEDFNKKNLSCIFVSPIEELNKNFGFAHSTDADTRTRAYFKIQDGCDYKCSFCTIPLARGLSKSMEPEFAVKEFRSLVASGYKEIILTGVNVGDYGKSYNTILYNLLKKFLKTPGDYRIRISSIEPNLLSDEIIKLAAGNPKICNHFHIPLQSGNPKILKLMKRRYTVAQYEKIINQVVKNIPDVGIGADVIVGFPGENDEEFLQTQNFLKDLPISYLHVFTYSERPNTKAITLPGMVDIHERRERTNTLRVLSEKKRNYFYREMKGKYLQVLFEGEYINGNIYGFSSNYVRVKFPFEDKFINQVKTIKISDISEKACSGEIIEDENQLNGFTAYFKNNN
jgi:threonylcarbamoyladenosine tRNA methylthiotransferase MtaB